METILVLEDDAANREAIRLILQLDGYSVEAAEAPAEAIHLCRILPALDLLVTDVGLASGSGTEAALEAVQCRSDLPVLFISGKSMEAWELRDQMYFRHFPAGKVDFLQKPFLASALQERVRALLRSEPAGKKPPEGGDPKICHETKELNPKVFGAESEQSAENAQRITTAPRGKKESV